MSGLVSDDLKAWVKRYMPGAISGAELNLNPVSGDAGFREYFRINSIPPLVVAHAPPAHENNEGFVAISLNLAAAGVHTPRIYAVDYQAGYILQEDLGDRLYQRQLNGQTVSRLYAKAENVLLRMQLARPDEAIYPSYDASRLRAEMLLFPRWFVEQLLGRRLADSETAMLDELFTFLITLALEQPRVVVHRDFHSRNLFDLPGDDVGVIDFQDAVIGPCTYDLVSLLRDCYVRWPESLVRERVSNYYHQARTVGVLNADIDEQRFQRWFDLMGLQRHIKVLGIFARLYLRDGKAGYLNDLPLVLRYALEVARRHDETARFYDWFAAVLEPLLPEQAWYRDWRTAGEA